MNNIHIDTSEAIKKEKPFEEVISSIAKNYSKAEWKSLEGAYGETRLKSGIYRGNHSGKFIATGEKMRTWGPLTGYGGRGAGKNGGYPDYVKRLEKTGENITPPYNNFTLTKTRDWFMFHPNDYEVTRNMAIISERYKIFQDLVKEYNKTGRLTSEQKAQADDIISEIYYLMANTCPFKRGSNGICDVLMRSQYSALGINMPHVKPDVGLDLEAFCFELGDYKANWRAFFEGGVPIKFKTYNPKKLTTLKQISELNLIGARELVEQGLMRQEFMDKVINAKSIEECQELMKNATTKWESLFASNRIPKQ